MSPNLSDCTLKLQTSLKSSGLVPGPAEALVPQDFTPTTALNVSFDGRAVDCGNLFRAGECKRSPTISFAREAKASPAASYLLMLVDPDAPTPEEPKFAYWRHWVVPGLQPTGGDGAELVAETKRPLTEYLGPGPKDESTPHRYLFLLFEEPAGLDLPKEAVGGEEFVQRRSFDPVAFVKAHQLKLVAVNWMRGAGDGWTKEE
ncbi:hypothetical protein NLU13_1055 [Sarocladium strictum]|uniref:Phosphatidylethanolamine-binding protein n=1 Tax=Sarocladium strictum TaxID=5046 RepID=A0AA39GQ83_SARSR|nr:hypothetical protein NLU13_1055 [Sarocladium strictum]